MTQRDEILEYLQAGNSLTALEALDKFKTMRLASRISELRSSGYIVMDKMVHDQRTGKRYKSYFMDKLF